jgi:hypothetical protein
MSVLLPQLAILQGRKPTYEVSFTDVDLRPTLSPNDDKALKMKPGVSRPDGLDYSAIPFAANIDFAPAQVGGNPGGATIKVQRTAKSVAEGQNASRTYYLTLPPPLFAAETAFAQLIFDLPSATLINKPGVDEIGWAVALNYKDGNCDDLGDDNHYGATCHFAGDLTKLNMTNTADPHPPLQSYDDYRTKLTSFALEIFLIRHLQSSSGLGILRVGADSQQGDLNTPAPAFKVALLDAVTQVGFAVILPFPDPKIPTAPKATVDQTVSVRIQSFRLWINPFSNPF